MRNLKFVKGAAAFTIAATVFTTGISFNTLTDQTQANSATAKKITYSNQLTTTASIALRTTAGSNAKVLVKIPKGSIIKASKKKVLQNGKSYTYITYEKNGKSKKGYIETKRIKTNKLSSYTENSKSGKKIRYKTIKNMYIRTAPGLAPNTTNLKLIKKNHIVKINGHRTINGKKFIRMQDGSKHIGYIDAKYIKKISNTSYKKISSTTLKQYKYTASKNISLRDQTGTDFTTSVVGKIKKGTVIKPIQTSVFNGKSYTQLKTGKTTGWILSSTIKRTKNVDVAFGSFVKASGASTFQSTYKVNSDITIVDSNKSNAKTLGKIKKGQYIYIQGYQNMDGKRVYSIIGAIDGTKLNKGFIKDTEFKKVKQATVTTAKPNKAVKGKTQLTLSKAVIATKLPGVAANTSETKTFAKGTAIAPTKAFNLNGKQYIEKDSYFIEEQAIKETLTEPIDIKRGQLTKRTDIITYISSWMELYDTPVDGKVTTLIESRGDFPVLMTLGDTSIRATTPRNKTYNFRKVATLEGKVGWVREVSTILKNKLGPHFPSIPMTIGNRGMSNYIPYSDKAIHSQAFDYSEMVITLPVQLMKDGSLVIGTDMHIEDAFELESGLGELTFEQLLEHAKKTTPSKKGELPTSLDAVMKKYKKTKNYRIMLPYEFDREGGYNKEIVDATIQYIKQSGMEDYIYVYSTSSDVLKYVTEQGLTDVARMYAPFGDGVDLIDENTTVAEYNAMKSFTDILETNKDQLKNVKLLDNAFASDLTIAQYATGVDIKEHGRIADITIITQSSRVGLHENPEFDK